MKIRTLPKIAFYLLAASLLLTQQVSVPNANKIPIIIPIFFILIFTLLLSRLATLKNNNLLVTTYFFAIISFLYALVFGASTYSSLSFLYFIVLYSIFFATPNRETNLIERLPLVGLVFAILGIFQFATQQIGIPFVDIRAALPESLLLQGYNYSYETSYKSGLFKSNGVTFLEPSFFSQFLALFFIIEFHNKRRLTLLVIFALSILTSYSGTGLLILLFWVIGLPFSTATHRGKTIGIFVIFTIIAFATLSQNDYLFSRIFEITRNESSAHIRFIAPILNYFDILASGQLSPFFFGLGPGAVDNLNLGFQANYTAFFKALLEYGVLFSIAYTTWWIKYIKTNAPTYLLAPLLTFIFLASGAFLQPLTLFTAWTFCYFTQSRSSSK